VLSGVSNFAVVLADRRSGIRINVFFANQPECPPAISVTPRSPLATVHSGDVRVHSGLSECSVTSPECTVFSGESGVTAHWRTLRLVSAPVLGPGRDAIVN